MNYDRIYAAVGPAERRKRTGMDCPICRELERAYEVGLIEFIEARSSAIFRVSTELAAFKNVEMERAKSELEEHVRVCASAARVLARLSERNMSTSVRRLVA